MTEEKKRAGANPAQAEPSQEALPLHSVQHAIAVAMLHLEDNLLASTRLLKTCTALAQSPMVETELEAVKTAVRLLRNQSDAAHMLAQVARGESRHRTIVEHRGQLNSEFFPGPPKTANGAAHDGNA